MVDLSLDPAIITSFFNVKFVHKEHSFEKLYVICNIVRNVTNINNNTLLEISS